MLTKYHYTDKTEPLSYYDTLATVKYQMLHMENQIPATVISVKAVHVVHSILLDCLTPEVTLEEPEITRTDPNIPIANK